MFYNINTQRAGNPMRKIFFAGKLIEGSMLRELRQGGNR